MRLSPIVLLALLAGGCANVHFPYVINVQQGNAVTPDMVAKLKPGMTRSQVRFILGTPLTVDMFRSNRWDYAYEFHQAGTLAKKRRVTVFFKGDALARVEEVDMGQDTAPANLLQSPPSTPSAAAGGAPAAAETSVVAPLGAPSPEKTPAPAAMGSSAAPLQLTPATTLPAPATPAFPTEPAAPDSATAPNAQ